MSNSTADTVPVRQLSLDVLDREVRIALQLEALLQHAYGVGGESFRALSDELQDSYLWACADLAEELSDLLQQGTKRHRA